MPHTAGRLVADAFEEGEAIERDDGTSQRAIKRAAKRRKRRLPKLMNRLARLKGSSLLAGRSGGLQTSLLAGGGISSMQTSILGG